MTRAYSRLILGCGNFGGIGSAPAFFGQGETKEEAFAIMDAAWNDGLTTFDTADAYGGGRSETWIGEWRRRTGHEPFVVTKTFNPMDEGADHGLAPARLRLQLESSLQRLGVDSVDLYLTHDWDPDVPIAETAGVLGALVAEGKIEAYGLSNVDGAQLREGVAAGAFGWVQNSYSLLDRDAEEKVLPLCAGHGLGFMPFSPLAGGWLTGKYRRDEAAAPGSRMTMRPEPYMHLQADEIYDRLERLAELGDPATLAFAWLFSDPRVTAVVVGPRRPAHLAPALTAVAQPLSPAQRDELSALFSQRRAT
jgi:aryl-alcohol dehydrogenase-like predicted oxidoreductase